MPVSILTAVHVLGVVVWIGGVAFVTMIVLPMIMRMEDSFEKVLFFQGVEHRFAGIAKSAVGVVGLTGVWMLYISGEWRILFSMAGIGRTLIIIVWIFYLFVLLFDGRIFKLIFKGSSQQDSVKIFSLLSRFHLDSHRVESSDKRCGFVETKKMLLMK